MVSQGWAEEEGRPVLNITATFNNPRRKEQTYFLIRSRRHHGHTTRQPIAIGTRNMPFPFSLSLASHIPSRTFFLTQYDRSFSGQPPFENHTRGWPIRRHAKSHRDQDLGGYHSSHDAQGDNSKTIRNSKAGPRGCEHASTRRLGPRELVQVHGQDLVMGRGPFWDPD